MNSPADLFIALLHHPVYNKKGEVVTTAVTNLDLHDIARIGATYGAKRFFIVTPLTVQQNFVHRMLSHWQGGFGAEYNPSRKEALDIIAVRSSLEEVREEICSVDKGSPYLVATTASRRRNSISFQALRSKIIRDGDDVLLLFGTGWGMTQDVLEDADAVLDPVQGPTEYNHLSVRSAVAIILDRLMGQRDD